MPDNKTKLEKFDLGPVADISEDELLERLMSAIDGYIDIDPTPDNDKSTDIEESPYFATPEGAEE